ncbi:Terminal uridylyltransferase cid1 [Lachnellula arida]|uniref:polynucleotide adenylyltransferase n=1 Tax=Lachnellula arida TaxID=1316785 RepID=A0A8T9B706_9HELO|nr:Terminal uridylyltransferase cid1 [Lachnellula arida]
MFPSSNEQDGGQPLEARLRNLIISNANADSNSNQVTNVGQQAPGNTQIPAQMVPVNPAFQEPPRLPPHMQAATPTEKQEYLANASSRAPQVQGQNQGQTPRKRLNQAQRRQMNSQISIPVDTRPVKMLILAGDMSLVVANLKLNGVPVTMGCHSRYSPLSINKMVLLHLTRLKISFREVAPVRQCTSINKGHILRWRREVHINRNTFNRVLILQDLPNKADNFTNLELEVQGAYLENLLQEHIPVVLIDPQEAAEKEYFRALVEKACRESVAEYELQALGNKNFNESTVELQCFGSMMSGFATKASDMDLALLSPNSNPAPESPDSAIPRLLEKKLLSLGFGARLLTRTRVPIIKLCQKPTAKLMADLLEERTKWETGFIEEQEEEEVVDVDASKKEPGNEHPDAVVSPISEETSAKPSDTLYEGKLATLKQKERQTLVDYHNNAKRLLRRLGGRDITATSADLNDEESKILNDVCKAFISGLSSPQLALRLQNYQTIAPLFNQSLPPIQRTLHGISIQIEGERLAMAWEDRPLAENNERREFQGLAEVEGWRVLQDKQGALVESLAFERLLWVAAEKLKKISSLQLVFLEQTPHEEPVSYYTRAQRLFEDLRHPGSSNDTVAPIVMAHYMAGITDKAIREALQLSIHKDATLQRLSVQHRLLQLVADYKHALQADLYDNADRPHVEQYLVLLNSLNYTDPSVRLRTPLTRSEEALLAKVRTLPDPTTVSPNKPRDRYKDHLEFPKTDIGIQCDINFSAHLAIHNTLLLRCYSHCDPRVKLVILFIKHWAKVRGINTPYRGSLSSYGYVLMVLHYLVNVASPGVCPNLQIDRKDPPSYLPPAEIEARTTCNGCDVRFWRNEAEIKDLASKKMLNHNHDSVGVLLRGFFEYYAQPGQMSTVNHRGFDWGREVLSLRTKGGILTKQEKGWVGAKTTFETTKVAPPTPTAKAQDASEGAAPGAEVSDAKTPRPKAVEETKEIRHRYLFAIEDPFELDHNVARTVTHNGIVSIRDEFRRTLRIIRAVGKPDQRDGGLLNPLDTTGGSTKGTWPDLLHLIHGPAPKEPIKMEKDTGGEV